ncbi:MAG: nucleotidyltransferase domain-containing protein [Candidatus Lambdaproteobacteria bacterium]|nr:nucleotidyltransferase domain-containing protein [Candidatus Lambdaproteobacteria bacterium]
MHPFVEEKLPQVIELCRRHHVARLELFGSAATGRFDPESSDIDFLLEYLPEAKRDYPDVYFDLKADLETLFRRPVDLVMINAIRNPYFRREIEQTRVRLYAA